MSQPLGGLRGVGQKVKSEHSHVAYQIIENQEQECSNMVTNILAEDPSPDPGDGVSGSKFNFFRTWSYAYQI